MPRAPSFCYREDMRGWDTLPDQKFIVSGEITAQFVALGIANFRSAARFVHQLRYGRNADRADFRLVLSERRGTCSTKHALLAKLAIEQQLEVDLTLGIYEMSESNTPGVGAVLDKYGM